MENRKQKKIWALPVAWLGRSIWAPPAARSPHVHAESARELFLAELKEDHSLKARHLSGRNIRRGNRARQGIEPGSTSFQQQRLTN